MEQEFINIIKPVLDNKEFQNLKDLEHHNITRYEHSLHVAYESYLLGKRIKGIHLKELVIGALLHDFFLYERYKNPRGRIFHGLLHQYEAVKNSRKNFILTEIETDVIKKHMFPICLGIPRYKETWIVTYIDKICSIKEKSLKYKEIII